MLYRSHCSAGVTIMHKPLFCRSNCSAEIIVFCRCHYSAAANVLQMPLLSRSTIVKKLLFCRIIVLLKPLLQEPLFCRSHYYVGATVLQGLLFCRSQYSF
jgi:hypothetical protein